MHDPEDKARCPRCDSAHVALILYGLIVDTQAVERAYGARRIAFGGCCVGPANRRCDACGHRWKARTPGNRPRG